MQYTSAFLDITEVADFPWKKCQQNSRSVSGDLYIFWIFLGMV